VCQVHQIAFLLNPAIPVGSHPEWQHTVGCCKRGVGDGYLERFLGSCHNNTAFNKYYGEEWYQNKFFHGAKIKEDERIDKRLILKRRITRIKTNYTKVVH